MRPRLRAGGVTVEAAVARTASVTVFERKHHVRKPFLEHPPCERVVIPAPCSCSACGGLHPSKLGEDVIKTLKMIPSAWKVVQTVRDKFACRDCEIDFSHEFQPHVRPILPIRRDDRP